MSRQLDWYYRNLKNGLCGLCGKHPKVSESCCELCLAKMRFRINDQRAKARAFRRVKGTDGVIPPQPGPA